MKVLYLSPKKSPIMAEALYSDQVKQTADKITVEDCEGYDIIVSYGYRHILTQDILDKIPAINLHISLLPFNRGADPNFWSWIEDTPKGVTIHWMDEGIDTGNIICQKEVTDFGVDPTLRSSYDVLTKEIESMFLRNWDWIRTESPAGHPQAGPGSYHRFGDKGRYGYLLDRGWDTSVSVLQGYYEDTQASNDFWEKYVRECGALSEELRNQ